MKMRVIYLEVGNYEWSFTATISIVVGRWLNLLHLSSFSYNTKLTIDFHLIKIRQFCEHVCAFLFCFHLRGDFVLVNSALSAICRICIFAFWQRLT